MQMHNYTPASIHVVAGKHRVFRWLSVRCSDTESCSNENLYSLTGGDRKTTTAIVSNNNNNRTINQIQCQSILISTLQQKVYRPTTASRLAAF